MRKSIIAVAAFALTSTSALAADYTEPVPEAFSWTGVYAGLFAAYSDVGRDLELSTVNTSVELDDSFSGFSGGALLGFNYQFDSVVIGIEGDVAFASIDESDIISAGATVTNIEDEIDTTYGIRARLGYALDRTLLFVSGGVAWADYEAKLRATDGIDSATADLSDETLFGWQIGGGVEQAVTDNVTVRLEYLYTDYDSESNGIDVNGDGVDEADSEVDLDSHTIRLGVNFLFGAF